MVGGIDPTGDIYDDYYKDLERDLKQGGQGIDFFPYFKKAMRKDDSTHKYTSLLKRIYGEVAGNRAIDTGQLFGNLSDPAKGTYIREQFKHAAPAAAADQYLSSFDAILGAGEYGDIQRSALAQMAQQAVTRYGQRYAGEDPRKIPTLNRWVGRGLRGYV